MQKEILELHKTLKECILTDSQRVAIRNEIGELEDQVALLDFQECEDIDYGYHAQYDFWHKSLVIKGLGEPGCRKSLNISHLHKYLCEHKKAPEGASYLSDSYFTPPTSYKRQRPKARTLLAQLSS